MAGKPFNLTIQTSSLKKKEREKYKSKNLMC